jgi:hypothetical protein
MVEQVLIIDLPFRKKTVEALPEMPVGFSNPIPISEEDH